MSYEGYEQYICQNGHAWTEDCSYSFEEEDRVCPICQAKQAWYNAVDDTNGESCGYIDMEKLLVKPAVVKTCNLGCAHVVEPSIYRIPSKQESALLQTYQDEGVWKPCKDDAFRILYLGDVTTCLRAPRRMRR